MRLLVNLVLLLLCLMLLALGALLGFDNHQPIVVTFLNWNSPDYPAYYWFIGFMLIGFLLAFSLLGTFLFRQSLKIRKLQSQIKQSNKELGALRANSLIRV